MESDMNNEELKIALTFWLEAVRQGLKRSHSFLPDNFTLEGETFDVQDFCKALAHVTVELQHTGTHHLHHLLRTLEAGKFGHDDGPTIFQFFEAGRYDVNQMEKFFSVAVADAINLLKGTGLEHSISYALLADLFSTDVFRNSLAEELVERMALARLQRLCRPYLRENEGIDVDAETALHVLHGLPDLPHAGEMTLKLHLSVITAILLGRPLSEVLLASETDWGPSVGNTYYHQNQGHREDERLPGIVFYPAVTGGIMNCKMSWVALRPEERGGPEEVRVLETPDFETAVGMIDVTLAGG